MGDYLGKDIEILTSQKELVTTATRTITVLTISCQLIEKL